MSIKKFIKNKKAAFDKYKESKISEARMKARLQKEQTKQNRIRLAQEAREAREEWKAIKMEESHKKDIERVKAYKKPEGFFGKIGSGIDKFGAGVEKAQKTAEPLFNLGEGFSRASSDSFAPKKDLFGNSGGMGFDLFGEAPKRRTAKRRKKRKSSKKSKGKKIIISYG